MSWIHFLEFFFAVLLGLSLHNHRAHFFWRCVRSLKKSDLYDCISCESEFCVTTGRNVPTTAENLGVFKSIEFHRNSIVQVEKIQRKISDFFGSAEFDRHFAGRVIQYHAQSARQ